MICIGMLGDGSGFSGLGRMGERIESLRPQRYDFPRNPEIVHNGRNSGQPLLKRFIGIVRLAYWPDESKRRADPHMTYEKKL